MTYTDAEYQQHLSDDNWTRSETDHMMELAKRFDMRFVVMHDRWNRDRFPKRSVEDLKERYYNISNTLIRVSSNLAYHAVYRNGSISFHNLSFLYHRCSYGHHQDMSQE